jgi:uncharacterized phosphosugar-binding protein
MPVEDQPLAYLATVKALLDELDGEAEGLRQAARWCATALADRGLIHVFGSGHSHMVAEEAFHRAGGLVPVNAVLVDWLTSHRGGSDRASLLERQPGLGELIVSTEPVEAGDVFFVVSNSGRNAVPVEVAQAAKARGAKVVALTSVAHSSAYPARTGGAKLMDVADLVIDTHVPPGDAAVAVADGMRAGGVSSVMSFVIIQTIVVATAQLLAEEGRQVPLFKSANEDGADRWNAEQIKQLGRRIPTLLRTSVV